MAGVRHLEKFTSLDGSTVSYSFPTALMEYEPSASVRQAFSPLVGASYAFDHYGTQLAHREMGRESVRFIVHQATEALVEDELDAMRSKVLLGAQGKIWTVDADSARRWAYARVTAMPSLRVSYDRRLIVGAGCEFSRFSDWYDESLTTDTETITADAQTWTVNNPGNLPVLALTMRLRANASGGITNPIITNTTSNPAYVFATARDSASADDEIRLRTDIPDVGYSDDDGVSYVDDFANITIPTSHPPLAFLLMPGNNTLRANCGGTPNFDCTITFYGAFA